MREMGRDVVILRLSRRSSRQDKTAVTEAAKCEMHLTVNSTRRPRCDEARDCQHSIHRFNGISKLLKRYSAISVTYRGDLEDADSGRVSGGAPVWMSEEFFRRLATPA